MKEKEEKKKTKIHKKNYYPIERSSSSLEKLCKKRKLPFNINEINIHVTNNTNLLLCLYIQSKRVTFYRLVLVPRALVKLLLVIRMQNTPYKREI